jgi:hypothetical protein
MHRASGLLDLPAQGQCQGQGCQERLTPAQSVNPATLARVVVVDDEDSVILKSQTVALVNAALNQWRGAASGRSAV